MCICDAYTYICTYLSGVYPMNANSISMYVSNVIQYINFFEDNSYLHKITYLLIYICVVCLHICVMYILCNKWCQLRSSSLTYWGKKRQTLIEVGIEESSLTKSHQQALRQEGKLLEGRDSCPTRAWAARCSTTTCGANTEGGIQRIGAGELRGPPFPGSPANQWSAALSAPRPPVRKGGGVPV